MIAGILLFLSQLWQIRNLVFQISYDLINENEYVETKEEIDQILSNFNQIGVERLDDSYKLETKISDPNYQKMLSGTSYYLVPQNMIYKRIAGKTRIKDVISRDQFYKSSFFNTSTDLVWLIDKRILYNIIELRKELEKRSYNKDGFWVRHGYRTPKYNEEVNGASKSRHIKGEAGDMVIQDINGDGKYTEEDKSIVIEILENRIIKDKGGIGKYPGTRTVHMDVRGYRARWDSY